MKGTPEECALTPQYHCEVECPMDDTWASCMAAQHQRSATEDYLAGGLLLVILLLYVAVRQGWLKKAGPLF
jgi:hypothetical protein